MDAQGPRAPVDRLCPSPWHCSACKGPEAFACRRWGGWWALPVAGGRLAGSGIGSAPQLAAAGDSFALSSHLSERLELVAHTHMHRHLDTHSNINTHLNMHIHMLTPPTHKHTHTHAHVICCCLGETRSWVRRGRRWKSCFQGRWVPGSLRCPFRAVCGSASPVMPDIQRGH